MIKFYIYQAEIFFQDKKGTNKLTQKISAGVNTPLETIEQVLEGHLLKSDFGISSVNLQLLDTYQQEHYDCVDIRQDVIDAAKNRD